MTMGSGMSLIVVRETLRIGYLSLAINLMGLAILRARAGARQARVTARRSGSKSSREQQ